MARIEAVDLFCGAGGLTRGLEDAGVHVRAGFDIDPDCKYPYDANNSATFVLKSVVDLSAADITSWFTPGAVRLLAGCAPCQPFSTMANNSTTRDEKKWGLLGEFARLVREIQPELVTMENVPRVTNHAPYRQFISALEDIGYKVDARVMRCADMGIPQERRRFVLVASRLGDIHLHSEPSVVSTVRDAIGNLAKLAAGETDPHDLMHKARALTKINLDRIRASLPGGTWQDWPPHLLSPCHQVESGASYKSVYSRMVWEKPSPTITTQCCNFGTGRFGHPEQDRAITLREAAILQSFPTDYRFVPEGQPISFSSVGRMIGNAVPPKLGLVVGKTLLKHLEQFNEH